MADLSDILIEGETILWQGQPDFSKARHVPDEHVSRKSDAVWRAGLALVLILIAAALFIAGFRFELTGFFGTCVATLASLLLLGAGFALMARTPDALQRSRVFDHYVITDRRLFAVSKDGKTVQSFTDGRGTFLELHKNGDVHNLVVSFMLDDGEHFLIFSAIEDGPRVHRLALQTLTSAKDTSQ